jgi:photosystem II stability/assembly factor-like uncharacterized protein
MKPQKILAIVIIFLISSTSLSIAQEWAHTGPYSVWSTSIAVDPIDTSRVYVGTHSRGVWESIDSGQNWTEMNEGFPVTEVSLIIADPNHPGRVWAGTYAYGLLKYDTDDGSWISANVGLPEGNSISRLLIMPDTPDTMFLGVFHSSESGLYMSNDGGNSWSLIEDVPHSLSYSITCLEVDPNNNNHIFVGVDSPGLPEFAWGMLESWDAGNTWEILNENFTFYKLQIDPENSLNLWAMVLNTWQQVLLAFSTNGGVLWEYYPDISTHWNWISELYADSEWNLYVQEEYYLWKSTDQGQNWISIATDINSADYPVHIESNPLDINSVFMGQYRWGLYHSNDGGITNNHIENGINNSYVQTIRAHPTDPDITYAGGFGFWKRENSEAEWQRIVNEEVRAISVDPLYPDTLYWGGDSLKRSFDGGETFEDIRGSVSGSVTAFAVNPVSTNILYCATYHLGPLFYRSEDYGETWQSISVGFQIFSFVSTITIDEVDPDVVYIGQAGLYKSEDSGLTWERISDNEIGSLVLVPDSEIMFATSGLTDVIYSNDGGYSFENITGSLSVSRTFDLVINPNDLAHLFVSSVEGVFHTHDQGNSWQYLDGPYQNRSQYLAFSANQQTLHIGTNGYGVWSVTDSLLHVESNPSDQLIPSEFAILPPTPNPFNPTVSIPVHIPLKSDVTIAVYNILGQRVRLLHQGLLSAGRHIFTWNGEDRSGQNVAAGMYLVTMLTPSSTLTKKVVLLK